jgi:outer membrane protein assembly factor BamB
MSASLSSAEDAAGPEAWPMFRGTPTGSGRSSVVLQLPLKEQWHRRFEGGAFTATPVINSNTIYLGDLDGHFMALSLNDGKTLWQYDSPDSGFPSAAAVSTKANYPFVVVGDDLGVIRCMNSDNGKVVWNLSMEGEISGGPTILNVSKIPTVLIGSQDATLICLRMTDGEILWKHEIADQIRCSPTVDDSTDSKRVFLAGCDSTLHILNVVNGETVAEIPLGGPTGTTPSIDGSDVFFLALRVAIFLLSIFWRRKFGGKPGEILKNQHIAQALPRLETSSLLAHVVVQWKRSTEQMGVFAGDNLCAVVLTHHQWQYAYVAKRVRHRNPLRALSLPTQRAR